MSYHLSLSLGQAPASHPHLLIALPDSEPASRDRFHVSFTLPDSIFVDRDELIDIWGQGAGSRVQWTLTPDKIDIERPITNATERSNLRVGWSEGQLDVPLHVRYLEPNDVGPEVVTLFQEHDVKAGWSCVGLGDSSCLSEVQHEPLRITLPTGLTSDRALVELATPVFIWLGWIYLVIKICSLSKRTRHIKTD